MNLKNIKATNDTSLCMKCLKKKATNFYNIYGRGYGSDYDMEDMTFQCCDECDDSEYKKWFEEKSTTDGYEESYQYEENITNLINNLPLEGQELFWNRLNNNGFHMEPQDWIDYELKELPHEKCREYHILSPKDEELYNSRFPSCENVINVIWPDSSKGSRCPFGVCGAYGQKANTYVNSTHCTDCEYYKQRTTPLKEIKGEDLQDWKSFMTSKLKEKEFKKFL